jgi:23S rRNA (guanosine2251-2'-O)-methyltransferase
VAGIHAVRELLRVRPRSVTHFWLKDSYAGHPDLADLAEMAATHRLKPTIQAVSALDRISSSHQGVVAYSNETPEFDFNAIKQKPRATLVVLDEVEDPHNLGAVLRTAWLFGAAAVLTPASRAAPLTATVAKVAQGAAEHVPVVQESGLLETLKQLKQEGFWLFGLAHKG